MKLYSYWRSSCSYRVRIALNFKGVAYTYAPVHLLRDGGQQHQGDFVKASPLAQVPVLDIGGGRLLSQSMAIVEYLEETHPSPSLLPSDPYLRARTRQLVEMVNAGIQPLQNLSVTQYVRAQYGGDPGEWTRRFVEKGLAALEQACGETAGAYMVGATPSLADVFLIPQLYSARRFNVQFAACPTLLKIEEACLQLDAFAKAHPNKQPDAEE